MPGHQNKRERTIDAFTQFDFPDDGIEHAIYRKGLAPGCL